MRTVTRIAALVLALVAACGSELEVAEEATAFTVLVHQAVGTQCETAVLPPLAQVVDALAALGITVRASRTVEVDVTRACGERAPVQYELEVLATDLAVLEPLGWEPGRAGSQASTDRSAVDTAPAPGAPPLVIASGGAEVTMLPGDTCWLVGGDSRCTEGVAPRRANLPTIELRDDSFTLTLGAVAGSADVSVVPLAPGREVPDPLPFGAVAARATFGVPALVALEPGDYVLLVRAALDTGEVQGAALVISPLTAPGDPRGRGPG